MGDAAARPASARRRGVKAAAAPTPALRVLIVDDHPLWRESLRNLLKVTGTARQVLEAEDGATAVDVARAKNPHVVLMDLDLPPTGGIAAIRAIVSEQPKTRVLVLSASTNRDQIVAAVRAGARGYLVKTSRTDDIVAGIHRVHDGELVFPPALADVVHAELVEGDQHHVRVAVVGRSVLAREGLGRVLADTGVDVIARAETTADLGSALSESAVDVVVADVGADAAELDDILTLQASHPDVAVLVLSDEVDGAKAALLLKSTAAGTGYLLKSRLSDVGELGDAVRRVAAGAPAVDRDVVAQLVAPTRQRDPLAELTERERDVLALMAEGQSNPAIAQQLHMTTKTVEWHIGTIFSKLGLEATSDVHRRVLAVITYLRAAQ